MKDSPASHSRRRRRVGSLAVTFAVIVGAVGCWLLVVLATNLLYPTIGLHADTYPGEIIRILLFFLLFGGLASIIGRIFGVNRPDYFARISEAMKRIASGDFSVSVHVEAQNPFEKVANSLNEMAESLQQIEAMRREFVSDVSHEIQSPLTSIAGFARALHDEQLSADERSRYLSIIEDESQRLSRLSDSLLKLSALDSNAQEPSPTRYRLDSQLRSVILSCEPQWSEKGIEVEAELAAVEIVADETMLGQVWNNLLHNAVKFTPTGGAVSVELRARERSVEVLVTDNGVGIESEDLPHVFERFFKADRSRTASAGGSGLGLSIAAKIVAMHGGEISARSEGLGKGSQFVVVLPLGASLSDRPRTLSRP